MLCVVFLFEYGLAVEVPLTSHTAVLVYRLAQSASFGHFPKCCIFPSSLHGESTPQLQRPRYQALPAFRVFWRGDGTGAGDRYGQFAGLSCSSATASPNFVPS